MCPSRPKRAARGLLLAALAGAVILGAASPASARRARRSRPAAIRSVLRTAMARAIPPAAVTDPVRSVILFIADGYPEADWQAARKDQAGGFLALDTMPVTGIALPPEGLRQYSPESLGQTLGMGGAAPDAPAPVTLLGLAKQYGKAVALVGGDGVAEPLPSSLVLPFPDGNRAETLERLAAAHVDVLFGRGPHPEALAPLAAAGYHVATDAQSLVTEQQTPAAAQAPAENVPFDTLVFRALHLAAKAPQGFMMAVEAAPDSVKAGEFDTALNAALRYARKDERTVVLVVRRDGDATLTLQAEGPGAHKFSGTIAATDVPKILAGLTGLKVFRRDYSPLFAPRSAAAQPEPLPLKTGTTGIQGLPW